MKKLACVLATRGRPDLAKMCVIQTIRTMTNENTVFMAALDRDDILTIRALEDVKNERVIISIKDREDTIAAKWNRALSIIPDADIYVPVMDKSPFLTLGTDSAILSAASHWPDGIGVVYNHPGQSGITGFQAITKTMVDIMGHIFPEIFPYWFTDPWLNDIAKQCGRIAYANCEIAHLIHQAPTQELREPAFWTDVFDSLYLVRRSTAHKIIDATCDEAWRKAILKSAYPILEAQSRRNISGTRALKVKEPEPDERYYRAKAAALELVRQQIPAIEEDQRETTP